MKHAKKMLNQIMKVDRDENYGLAKIMLTEFIERDDLHTLNGKDWLELMTYLSRYRPIEPWRILTQLSMRHDEMKERENNVDA